MSEVANTPLPEIELGRTQTLLKALCGTKREHSKLLLHLHERRGEHLHIDDGGLGAHERWASAGQGADRLPGRGRAAQREHQHDCSLRIWFPRGLRVPHEPECTRVCYGSTGRVTRTGHASGTRNRHGGGGHARSSVAVVIRCPTGTVLTASTRRTTSTAITLPPSRSCHVVTGGGGGDRERGAASRGARPRWPGASTVAKRGAPCRLRCTIPRGLRAARA
eukprot:1710128-Prymnesium_polylepis.1